jgi:hypothetical protein
LEAESIVIALVREYTAQITLNLAIFWESSRFSKRGKSFLLEVKDSKNEYQATAAFKDRRAVIVVKYERVIQKKASDGRTDEKRVTFINLYTG